MTTQTATKTKIESVNLKEIDAERLADLGWTPASWGCEENPGVQDNGDGSLTYGWVNPRWPSAQLCREVSYARRSADRWRLELEVKADAPADAVQRHTSYLAMQIAASLA